MRPNLNPWLEALRQAVRNGRIEYKRHALERLLERGIRLDEIETTLLQGEVIEFYPDAYPLPACLMLYIGSQPLHVVAAFDRQSDVCHVITVYQPSQEKFKPDWKTRKPQ